MRVAVISDIHGNCIALNAVLTDLKDRSHDRMVCLGDAIQGGPQPAQVVHRLSELECPVVMGNADAWLFTGEETGDEAVSDDRRQAMNDVRLWTLAQLSDDDRAFITAFQPTVELKLDDGFTLLAYHGSPKSFDDVILPDIAQDKLAEYLRGHTANAYCGGHTHVQFVRRIGAGPEVHFNPGSVGYASSHDQPDEGFQADHWAEYAILDVNDGRFGLEFHRVPFDVAALIATYQHSGRPHSAEAVAQYGG
jgi:predicted phosphodiesterase